MKASNSNIIRLPKRLLDSASPKKDNRTCLEGAFVDAENRTVVVCNGRVLAAHPLPGTEPVKPGYITPDIWKAAVKVARKDVMEFDFVAGTVNGIPIAAPDINGQFPNWRQVVPGEAPVYRTAFNADLLGCVASSLGVDSHSLVAEFAGSGLTPIRLRHGDSYGIIMPMRCTNGDETGSLLPTSEDDAAQRIAYLQAQVAKLSERSDAATTGTDPADAALIDSLHATIHEERANVRQLTAQLASQKADYDARIGQFAAKVRDLEARITAAMGGAPVHPLNTQPTPKGPKEKPPVPMATRPPVLSRNALRNGIELRFDGKPDDATRETLKAHGWRWLPGQPGQPWAVRYSEEEWIFANHLANGTAYTPMPMPAPAPAAPQTPASRLGFLDF